MDNIINISNKIIPIKTEIFFWYSEITSAGDFRFVRLCIENCYFTCSLLDTI